MMPRRYVLYHPAFQYVLGFLVFLLVPSAFSRKPYNFEVTLIDLCAIVAVFVGAQFGAAVKNSMFRAVKITTEPRNIKWLLISNAGVLFGLRVVHFRRVGLLSMLHPFASDPSLVSTVKGLLAFPYLSLLITGWVLRRKRIYLILIAMEVILVVIPTLSRSYLIYPVIYYFLIKHFYVGFTRKGLSWLAAVLVLVLLALNWLGPVMQAARSYVYIGKIEEIGEIPFGQVEEEGRNFLFERLDIHGNWLLIKGQESYVAELDYAALTSFFKKWLGYTAGYDVYPSGVSNIVGNELDFSPGRSVTGFPRNWILYHYNIGLIAVIVFNLGLGCFTTVVYNVIYKEGNVMFPYLWFPLIFGVMFSQDALASALVFGYFLVLYSLGCVLGIFVAITGFSQLAKAAVRSSRGQVAPPWLPGSA